MRAAHPSLLIERFLKEAQTVMGPAGMGDARRRMKQRDVGKDRQEYAQPAAPTAETRPDLISSQKALPPPPVT
jgi:hypothetical protein